MLIRNSATEPQPVPNEPGEWMRFRRLSPRKLQAIYDKRQEDGIARLRELGSDSPRILELAEQFARVAAAPGAEPATKRSAPDPVHMFDRTLLLMGGIAAWSYKEPDGRPSELTEDNVDDLDYEASYWAAREILKLNHLLPEEAEADRKN